MQILIKVQRTKIGMKNQYTATQNQSMCGLISNWIIADLVVQCDNLIPLVRL